MRKLAVALLLGLAACSGESASPEPPPPPPPPEAGCEEPRAVPGEGSAHVAEGASPSYKTDPPTSGPHLVRWESTGVHDLPLHDGNLVHNLEHSHMIIWHDGITPAQLTELARFARSEPRWVLVVPRPGMEVKLAFTAWKTLQRCADVPEDLEGAARRFFNARPEAPETIPGSPLPRT